jgi:hypothetical protein
MTLLFLIILLVAPIMAIIRLILRDENNASVEAELLREWEAQAIMSKLRGKALPVRPGYTNSPGPM